jgi:hypothetical protein
MLSERERIEKVKEGDGGGANGIIDVYIEIAGDEEFRRRGS